MPAMTINGVDAPAHAEFDVLNPSTGEVCGTAPEATKEQVDEAMIDFALSYADQTEKDHAALVEAAERGIVPTI